MGSLWQARAEVLPGLTALAAPLPPLLPLLWVLLPLLPSVASPLLRRPWPCPGLPCSGGPGRVRECPCSSWSSFHVCLLSPFPSPLLFPSFYCPSVRLKCENYPHTIKLRQQYANFCIASLPKHIQEQIWTCLALPRPTY